MAKNQIFENSMPTFVVTIKDQDRAIVNLSTATVKQLWFLLEGANVQEKDAAYVTDGSDGLIQWTATAAFLSAGKWTIQSKIVISGQTYFSDQASFTVHENLG